MSTWPSEEQIKASLERDLKDPAFLAEIQRRMRDLRTGNFADSRFISWPIPWWAMRALTWLSNPRRMIGIVRAARKR